MSSDPTPHDPAISPTPSSRSSIDAGRLAEGGEPFLRGDGAAVDWCVAPGLTGYGDAVAAMESLVAAITRGEAAERIWLVEHPPLYTAGTGAGAATADPRFPLHRTGRGGQVTYHGPGQRVAYVMLDLSARRRDLRAFVAALERWIIDALAVFSVCGERRADRVGVWVARPEDHGTTEDKIAAVGIRMRHWVSFHGISLNVSPDLSHYAGIVPCGIADPALGVTSLTALGRRATMAEVDLALRAAFPPLFGTTRSLDWS